MKVKQVVKLVRMKITDEDTNRWNDYQILDVINEAVRFIRNIFITNQPTMLSQKITGELTEGENIIELEFVPLNYIDVRCNGKRLHLTSLHYIDDTERRAEPNLFVPAGIKAIEVYPIPDKTYKYIVVAIPAAEELSEDDDLPFPEDYSDNVIEYAAMRLSMIDEFDQTVETQLITQIQTNVSTKLAEYAPMVHVVDSY